MTPTDEIEYQPLSCSQQGLWFLSQIEGAGEAYHMRWGVSLNGELDKVALHRALDRILARHDILRTSFTMIEGVPFQTISKNHCGFHLVEHDLRGCDDMAIEFDRLVMIEANASFDLQKGPLIRGRLIRRDEGDHALLITTHHIISDGWSMGVFVSELGTLYSAFSDDKRDPFLPIPLQYADYARWQRAFLTGELFEAQSKYWKAALAEAPTALHVPMDYPRPVEKDYSGSFVELVLDESLAGKLKALSRRHNVSLFMTLLAGWSIVLAGLSGEQDIIIGVPVANRRLVETEAMLGFFVNTLPLRINLSGSPDVRELLSQVKKQSIEGQQHHDLPFDEIVKLVAPLRTIAHNPLFQVMFAWQNAPESPLALPGLTVRPLKSAPHCISKFDLTLSLRPAGKNIAGGLEYATTLFERATVECYVEYLRTVLSAMADGDSLKVERLPLLSELERQKIVFELNDTKAEFPLDKCLHELVEAQVLRTPNAVAVICDGIDTANNRGAEHRGRSFNNVDPKTGWKRLRTKLVNLISPRSVDVVEPEKAFTYNELNRRANQLAHYLISIGVGPDCRVAVCFERGFEMVVALLSVLKAGGAYVPLDPTYPVERLAHILKDSTPITLLTHNHLAEMFNGLTSEFSIINLSASPLPWNDKSHANPDRNTIGLVPEHLAYVIYTSGSTGSPKGVMVEHRSVVNRLFWMQRTFGINFRSAVLQKTPFSFDVSVWELICPLIAGGRLVMALEGGHRDPSYLVQVIQRTAINIIHFVPSMLQAFLEHIEDSEIARCSSLEQVICSGEILSATLAKRFQRRFPNVTLCNLYGPTEATVDVSAWICPPRLTRSRIPIGTPIANTQIYVLDAFGKPVPIGVAGELHIGGVQVARGYLNKPELTEESFILDPFSSQAGARMYKTGDMGRWLPEGNIEFLGRNDSQVKIRGFRVELGEIEARLVTMPQIREAVVILHEDKTGNKSLIAYYTSSENEGIVKPGAFRTYLSATLPEQMIPVRYVHLASMSLTPSGKIDRRALPIPEDDPHTGHENEAPQGEIEMTMRDIWVTVLGRSRVGVTENFFDLGGHSLLALQVVAQASAIFKRKIPLKTLFVAQTIRSLAEEIRRLLRDSQEQTPDIISRVDDDVNLPLSINQEKRLIAEEVTRSRKDEPPLFNLSTIVRFEGELIPDILERTLNEIVHRHAILRASFFKNKTVPMKERVRREVMYDQTGIFEPGLFLHSILPNQPLILRIHSSEDVQANTIQRIIEKEIRAKISYDKPPLMRASLIELNRNHHLLVLVLPHLISDQRSMELLRKEICMIYGAFREGLPCPLPKLSLQFSDFASWQLRFVKNVAAKSAVDFWVDQWRHYGPERMQLKEFPPRATSGLDLQSLGIQSKIVINKEDADALRRFTRKRNMSLYMFFMTTFCIALHHYTGKKKIALWTNFANRVRPEFDVLIGWFVNLHLLGFDLSNDPHVDDILTQCCATILDAQSYQDIPTAHIWRVAGGMSFIKEATIVFELRIERGTPAKSCELPFVVIDEVLLSSIFSTVNISKCLRAGVLDNFDELELSLVFDQSILSKSEMRYLLCHWLTISLELPTHIELSTSQLCMLAAERCLQYQ